MSTSAHAKRQSIAVVRTNGDDLATAPASPSSAPSSAPGYVTFRNAPAGHALVLRVGPVYRCECGRARMSREGMVDHHDRVREERAAAGVARARAHVQRISLADIERAYRKAEIESPTLADDAEDLYYHDAGEEMAS